ncbi:hypothetical protein RFI02_14195 [Acinetobacter sichuanensis]|uniref:kelch repeat-containing protein n=1 Tax=Acinetobacter sichuanensis TaxID=2136183 RepID=UPI00280FC5DF|nr:hypothetical protein [Acinetobacter sichuanensis]MDQ9022255.1 hypothetical protein [Acinetobacter sichuanensis]
MTENIPTYTVEELARIEEFEAPYLQKIAERGITQNDIDALNTINHQALVTKKQNKDDIILWLLEHSNFATEDYIYPYIFSQYLRKNNIEIERPLWVAPNERMNHTHISADNKYYIFDLRIGGNDVFISGSLKLYETKDYYFPEFKIYNDVYIKFFDGTYELWNYPEEQFPPVYEHTTLYDEYTDKFYIIGGLGSGDRQRKNITEIYALDLETKDIQKIEALGESPPCLHSHSVKIWNRDLIEMKGGFILHKGIAIKNLYIWYFNLKTKMWLTQNSEKYQHWIIQAAENDELFLQTSQEILKMEEEKFYSVKFIEEHKEHLFKNYKYQPRYQLYPQLYHAHEAIYVSKIEGFPYLNPIYQCILQGQVYHCFEGYNRVEVAFQASTSNEFQQFIIKDLTSKLKQISGHDIVAEKLS